LNETFRGQKNLKGVATTYFSANVECYHNR
jgi:hypothetical protein